jgi:membrane-anchored protein YejM (alkaline phosphatase superfamily)
MSEQSKIIQELQELIMSILKTGIASEEEGKKLDKLEASLFKQRCFKKSSDSAYDYQGEEIAGLFFNDNFTKAIDKMYEYKISSEDFFGFVEYHYDEDEEDELEIIELFTDAYKEKVHNAYQSKCRSK